MLSITLSYIYEYIQVYNHILIAERSLEVYMKKNRKSDRVELNPHDRKILEKYSGYYTNFIESNTARTDIYEDKGKKTKE